MKVFISQAMRGRINAEVMAERQKAIEYLKEKTGKDIEVLENYNHEGLPKNANPLKYLGRSISLMADADAVYFCHDSNARGCIVERLICHLYNIPVII